MSCKAGNLFSYLPLKSRKHRNCNDHYSKSQGNAYDTYTHSRTGKVFFLLAYNMACYEKFEIHGNSLLGPTNLLNLSPVRSISFALVLNYFPALCIKLSH